jgi:hypothetical protein
MKTTQTYWRILCICFLIVFTTSKWTIPEIKTAAEKQLEGVNLRTPESIE